MVRVIGHRGASATYNENTIEAFVAAVDQGADGIELDVRRTADDVLVVYHDAHLKSGEMVRRLNASELPSSIPTLVEALEACGDTWVNIEIKNLPQDPDYDSEHGISVAVAGLVRAFDAADRVIISSFDISGLDRLRAADDGIPTAWLVWAQGDSNSLLERAVAHEMAAIHPHDLLVDEVFVQRAHDLGLEVNVWTIDDPNRIREMHTFGVDGIITNHPADALAVLKECEQRRSVGC